LQRSVQLGQWFQGEVDEMAQRLGMFFPSTLAAAVPMLSITRFEAAIVELRTHGMAIPAHPSQAYQDIDWHGIPLRLCIVTWQHPPEPTPDSQPVSSLLLILGMQTNAPLPDGLKLRVSTAIGLLHEPVAEFDAPFLFSEIQGQSGDTVVVTIASSTHRPPLTLSPYQLAGV